MPINFVKTDTPLGQILLASTIDALIGCWFIGQKYFPQVAPERLRQTPLVCPPGTTLGTDDESACLPAEFLKAKKKPAASATPPLLLQTVEELWDYFSGKRKTFSSPLEPIGTPFQRDVWQALLSIPYGQTSSYTRVAEIVGKPGASRAVGAAVGKNPLSIFIPCHRVLGKSGSLTGYAGGLDRKEFLLKLERGDA